MRNHRGSVYFILIPLILTVVLVSASAVSVFRYHHNTLSACQHHLLRSQEILAAALGQLLLLNSQAAKLRVQEIQTRAELAATVATPQLHLVAKAKYLVIRTQQTQLHLKQKKIISDGQLKAQLEIGELKQDLHRYTTQTTQLSTPKLHVLTSPPNSLAPTYYTFPYFSRVQRTTAKWDISLNKLIPTFVTSVVKKNEKIKLQCSATIEKRGTKWQSLLTRDKS